MSGKLSGKVAVVIGATGIVGSGAVHNFLTEGATVVAVGRDKTKLAALAKKESDNKNLIQVVFGDFQDEKAATGLREAVAKALPKDAKIDHVVTSVGFVLSSERPTTDGVKRLQQEFQDGLFPNFVSAQAFIPQLKTREGSSFAFVSGGLSHFASPDMLNVWTATVKGAAINALYMTVVAECAKDGAKVRVGNMCIHHGVAVHGEDKNQWGMPSTDTWALGAVFSAFAAGSAKGRQLCLEDGSKTKEYIAAVSS